MRRRLTAVLVPLAFLCLLLADCSREGNVNSPEPAAAPPLPSISTMSMDLSVFESAQVDAQAIKDGGYKEIQPVAGLESKLNFFNAAVRVYFLNLVVCAALVEPVAAFGVAVHSVPQPQDDGSWLWTYIFVNNAVEYSIFLNGKDMGSYTAWKMEVSSTDPSAPLDHLLWFEGEVQKDDSSGYWQFYEPTVELLTMTPGVVMAGAAEALSTPGVLSIRIDWKNREGNEHKLVFLVNKPGIPEEGSTLTYLELPTVFSVDFVDAKAGTRGIISWHPDGSGSIDWPDYRNGEKSCWDTHQYNTVCPE
ncbi:MAG: hypothetical protein NTX17_01340 [Candidatus Eisenbacteria bacterium]|nr:hypothetical protein [Candidatus Eisenbacteria bacterium]